MKMIQIRNVPDAVHTRLKVRAAEEGISLSDYLLREITQLTSRPTWEELMERIAAEGPVDLGISSAEIIRQQRGPI